VAVYAIGDLQGCYDEFRVLLDRLQFDPARDRLWLAGDLVNRGPGSLECLRYVRALGDAAITVLGNHDLHLLAVAADAGRSKKDGDTLDDVLSAPDRDELLDWLRQRPLLHDDPTLGWTLIHAGLPPEWSVADAALCAREVESALAQAPVEFYARMYGNEPDRWIPGLAGYDRLRFTVNCLTRLRYCTTDGRLLMKPKGPPHEAPPGAVPWFRAPARRSRNARILFGHWSALGWYAGEGVVSLDTGCVWGGCLTALRLDVESTAPPVQVGCRGTLSIEGFKGE
jgi:bis(5'-nucleosyl)-tetraphosphatase (symmetrical)